MSFKATAFTIMTFAATVTTGLTVTTAMATPNYGTSENAEQSLMNGDGDAGSQCCPFSDEQLKDNIMPLHNQLAKLMQLKGVSYTWKENGAKDVGLIAQDVEKQYPELVLEKNGLKQVDYQKLTGPIIEALREQQNEITSLRNEIKALRDGQK